jgi:hypothetical protein
MGTDNHIRSNGSDIRGGIYGGGGGGGDGWNRSKTTKRKTKMTTSYELTQ